MFYLIKFIQNFNNILKVKLNHKIKFNIFYFPLYGMGQF